MAKKPDSFYFDNYVACADLAVQAAYARFTPNESG